MTTAGIQQVQSFQFATPKTINRDYLLYLPKEYDTDQSRRWPFILFLHGAGERGSNLELVKSQGLAKRLQKWEDFQFVVVSPQCSATARWYSNVLNEVLDETVGKYRIDTDRIYVTGLSMGGFGTWALAIEYPHRFAAIAPICGGGDPNRVCAIKHLPVWTFHGARDRVVSIVQTEVMVDALKKCEGNVRFTVYPRAGHDSWTKTYANPALYEWFLEHSRTGAA